MLNKWSFFPLFYFLRYLLTVSAAHTYVSELSPVFRSYLNEVSPIFSILSDLYVSSFVIVVFLNLLAIFLCKHLCCFTAYLLLDPFLAHHPPYTSQGSTYPRVSAFWPLVGVANEALVKVCKAGGVEKAGSPSSSLSVFSGVSGSSWVTSVAPARPEMAPAPSREPLA